MLVHILCWHPGDHPNFDVRLEYLGENKPASPGMRPSGKHDQFGVGNVGRTKGLESCLGGLKRSLVFDVLGRRSKEVLLGESKVKQLMVSNVRVIPALTRPAFVGVATRCHEPFVPSGFVFL